MSRHDAPKRVLLVTTADTELWRYGLELAEVLATYGTETVFAVTGISPSGEQRRQARQRVLLHEAGYPAHPATSANAGSAGEWLLDLEAKVGADVVHLNHYTFAALPWRSPSLLVGRTTVAEHWRAANDSPLPTDLVLYEEAVGRGLHSAGALVTPSRALLETLRARFGPLPPASVIFHGLRLRTFRPAEKALFVLAEASLWNDGPYLAAVQKAARCIHWPLCIAGDDDDTGAGADSGGAPVCPAPTEGYRRAALYVSPARSEPFGWTILEAAAHGCALVLGDVPGLRELWDGAAVFVPPDDPDYLQTVLTVLTGDSRRLSALMVKARQRARQYSRAAMATGYLTVYGQLHATEPSGNRESV